MDISQIGTTAGGGVVVISILIFFVVIFSGGRSAKKVAGEMYEMYTSNNPDNDRWENLRTEYTLQDSFSRLWWIPGLLLAYAAVVVLDMHFFVGYLLILFFDWVTIAGIKNQGDFYAEMFSDPALMADRRWRKNVWHAGHWIATGGVVVGAFWLMTEMGAI